MNPFKNLPLALCFLLAGFLLVSSCQKDDPIDPEPEVVNIPDALLLAQVKARLGLSASQNVDAENILLLDTLNLDAGDDLTGALSGIADLTGMDKATNLVYIHLGNTNVTNLTPLKDLKKVTYFRINNTAVTDLSPLSGYTTLTYFNANTATGITDINPLGGNTGLKEIILRDVKFGNAGMTTIRKFTKLYRINMRSTGVTSYAVLAEMMALGALLDTTEGATTVGGADLDLRGNSADCAPIQPYFSQISNVEGC